ncbi:hypothetical protein ACT3SP_12670 [Brachybacterium sp. AOP43-C2-M15]|uniref:hypothetical protein n=1 Tax=Brachybacterium sp. AOP43-C2-M15 TaxID=3457661 RepID=UPI004033B01B
MSADHTLPAELSRFLAERTRRPGPAGEDAPADPAARAEHLLQLACLNYTRDRPGSIRRARALLAAEPELATADVFTMATTGAHEELARHLEDDPGAVHASGGPFDWPPLLHLAYGRLGDGPGRSAVRTAEILLAAGADPDAGFLWNGEIPPFTALTGVLGGGEQDQPPHPDALTLARMLLAAGADPNDGQALYNRMFREDDSHLVLLFEHGLGEPKDSVWRRRLGDGSFADAALPTPQQMLTEQLRWASGHGMLARARLLLEHGVDPDGRGHHPGYGDRTSYRIAVTSGFPEVAALLAHAGADTGATDTARTAHTADTADTAHSARTTDAPDGRRE